MVDIIYPSKFKRALGKLFGTKIPNEPCITLNKQQILHIFCESEAYSTLRKFNKDCNMVEMETMYDPAGKMSEITFRLFNGEERKERVSQ